MTLSVTSSMKNEIKVNPFSFHISLKIFFIANKTPKQERITNLLTITTQTFLHRHQLTNQVQVINNIFLVIQE